MTRKVSVETTPTCIVLQVYDTWAECHPEKDVYELSAPVSRRLYRDVLAQKVPIDGPVPRDHVDSWLMTFLQKSIPLWIKHDTGEIIPPRPIGDPYRMELDYISSYGVRHVTHARVYGHALPGAVKETGFSFGCIYDRETGTLGETFEFSPTDYPRFTETKIRVVQPALVAAHISSAGVAAEKPENCLAEPQRITEEVSISSMGEPAAASNPDHSSVVADLQKQLEELRAHQAAERVAQTSADNHSALSEMKKQLDEMKARAAQAESDRLAAEKMAAEATRMSNVSAFSALHPDVAAAIKDVAGALGDAPVPAGVLLNAVKAAERLTAAIPSGKFAEADVSSIQAVLAAAKAPVQLAESARDRPVTVKRGREDNVSAAPVYASRFAEYRAKAGCAV